MKRVTELFAALVALSGVAHAQDSADTRPRAVILNGFPPREARVFADSETAADGLEALLSRQGYAVARFKAPYNNLPTVGRALYGASVVVYYGHGLILGGRLGDLNSTNVGGMCLDTYVVRPAELRREIRFAPGAMVFLPSSCFASGNCVEDAGKVARPILEQRMSVYARGFLDCGATMVLSVANPTAYLTEWGRSHNQNAAYGKAAYTGKETTTVVDGLSVRYREPSNQLKPFSALVTRN